MSVQQSSLYSGPGPRPRPAILYQAPAVVPALTNTGVWHAPPILVSGAAAYRDGEFLYQDWLYDDHGAHELPDPNDPRAQGDTFSEPDGTYTYPTGPGYDNNAADLVEFPGQAADQRHRVPDHAQHAPEPIAGGALDRDRRDSWDHSSVPGRCPPAFFNVAFRTALNITTDGPLTVTLPGCNRAVHAG
jgi:hypothetical protein